MMHLRRFYESTDSELVDRIMKISQEFKDTITDMQDDIQQIIDFKFDIIQQSHTGVTKYIIPPSSSSITMPDREHLLYNRGLERTGKLFYALFLTIQNIGNEEFRTIYYGLKKLRSDLSDQFDLILPKGQAAGIVGNNVEIFTHGGTRLYPTTIVKWNSFPNMEIANVPNSSSAIIQFQMADK